MIRCCASVRRLHVFSFSVIASRLAFDALCFAPFVFPPHEGNIFGVLRAASFSLSNFSKSLHGDRRRNKFSEYVVFNVFFPDLFSLNSVAHFLRRVSRSQEDGYLLNPSDSVFHFRHLSLPPSLLLSSPRKIMISHDIPQYSWLHF